MNEATEPNFEQPVIGQVDREANELTAQETDLDRQIDLVALLKEHPISLVEAKDEVTVDDIRKAAAEISEASEKSVKNILVCDAYVEGIENGHRDSIGFVVDEILNIDHHAPVEEMSRLVSSANLAIQYVVEKGALPDDWITIVNHTDCDSVLSSAIMRGILEPLKEFGDAAIAADHTGEPNRIGDLLQAVQDERDIEFSLRNLLLLLADKPLEPKAEELLQQRYQDRERAKTVAENEMNTNQTGEIFYVSVDKKLDAGLLPIQLPEAKVIVAYCPFKDKATKQLVSGTYEAKVRLGLAAPSGVDLRKIMANVDKNWGGRWNGGSNKRSGIGTKVDIETYVEAIEVELSKYSG